MAAVPEVDDLHNTLMVFAERTNDLVCSANSKLEALVNSHPPELIATADEMLAVEERENEKDSAGKRQKDIAEGCSCSSDSASMSDSDIGASSDSSQARFASGESSPAASGPPSYSSGISSDGGSRSTSAFGSHSPMYALSGSSSRASKRPRLETDSTLSSTQSLSSSNPTSHSSLALDAGLQRADRKLEAVARLPTTRPRIPVEIIDSILLLLGPKHLFPVLLANSCLYPIARRRFYHTVTINSSTACVKFLGRIIASVRDDRKHNVLPAFVRCLDLNVSLTSAYKAPLSPSPSSPPTPFQSPPLLTHSFYTLLSKGLRLMTSLTSLSIDLPKTHSPTWIFDGCTFQLKQLTTSMHCRRPLAQFLDTQESIEELTLRGFQSESGWVLWSLLGGIGGQPGGVAAATAPAAANPGAGGAGNAGGGVAPPGNALPIIGEIPGTSFQLAPTSLPLLRSFNAIHAGPSVIHTVLSNRPVQVVSIPLFPGLSLQALEALSGASKPMKRLSVISFDPGAPSFLFEELGRRFGEELEALHLVMLMTDYDMQMLENVGKCVLGLFRCLKYITFMAAAPSEEANPVDESKVASQWHRACPTLRTIILPKGKVWFQGDPEVDEAITRAKGKDRAADLSSGESSATESSLSLGSASASGSDGDASTESGDKGGESDDMWIAL